MPTHRHLKLQLIRLRPLQDWHIPREGLFFLFPKGGAGEYLCDSSEQPVIQPLASGDVLVVHAGPRGNVCAAPGAELALFAFSVCIEHLVPIFSADEIPLVQPLLNGLRAPRFHPAANSAAVEWHRLVREVAPEPDLEHRTQLLHVAGAILSEEFKKLRPPLSPHERADAHVTHLFEELSVDQILNLSVEEMAIRFGCSRRHLNRLFNEHFGLPVAVLRMEMRLLKAVPLLRNPDFRIMQVARQCGFNHLGLFNACFKRRFGVSPGQWRRNRETDARRARAPAGGIPNCRLREFGLCPLGDTLGEAGNGSAAAGYVNGATPEPATAASGPCVQLAGQ